ncbi:hypothetical protein B0H11DRAFT_2004295 [Mycena galericulata]|nr:hypothetical protein B0H11DRAFT_2004295 [Mycena galericulata]
MHLFSRPAIFKLTFGILCVFSLVDAFPAVPNSDPDSKPGSLLVDSQTQQLNGHGPLGRADRFQIAQRRSAVSHGSQIVDESGASHDIEAREVLLSHEQLVPSVPSATPTAPTTAYPHHLHLFRPHLFYDFNGGKAKSSKKTHESTHDAHKGKKKHHESSE